MKDVIDLIGIAMLAAFLAFTLDRCAPRIAKASDDILRLQEMTFNYKHFADNNHAPYFADDARQKDAIEFNANTDIGPWVFWNQQVHGTSDPGQFHTVGYHFWLGVRVSQNIDFQYEHHSQHLLDGSRTDHFPVEDSLGLTLYLFKRNDRNAIWR